MTIPAKQTAGDLMESVLIKGDLSKLTPQERSTYYMEVCKSIGLNPLTRPFEYITLNGKLQLYALRACTDQLRKINNITLEIVSRDVADDILTIHVRARMGERSDEDLGSVHFPPQMKGDNRANAELKCVTKAKRRVTLSICGLGWLDETEVADIPASAKQPVAGPDAMARPTQLAPVVEQTPTSASGPQGTSATGSGSATPAPTAGRKLTIKEVQELENEARMAADRGSEALAALWKRLQTQQQRAVISGLQSELLERREAADKRMAAEAAKADPETGEIMPP